MKIKKIKNVSAIALAVIFTFSTVACGKKSSDIERDATITENVLSSKVAEVVIELIDKGVANISTTTEGTIVEAYNDGTAVETKKDGTVVETKIDGTVVEFKTDNGNVLVTTNKPSDEILTEEKKVEEITTQDPTAVQGKEIIQAPTQAQTDDQTEAPTQVPTQTPTEAPTQAPILSHAEAIQAFLDGFNAQRANYSMPPVTSTVNELNAFCASWAATMRDNGHYYHSNSLEPSFIGEKLGINVDNGVEGVGVKTAFTYEQCYLDGYVQATHIQVHNKDIYALGVDYTRGNYANCPDSVYWCVEVFYKN